MCSIRVDHKGSESLITLCGLPEEHDDLRREFGRSLGAWDVGGVGLNRLVQYPGHTIDNELKVLRTMQPSKEMTVVVFGS